MELRHLQKFLALSLLVHLFLIGTSALLIPGPMPERKKPVLIEVLSLPAPKEKQAPPEKPTTLSDINRSVERETRQKESPGRAGEAPKAIARLEAPPPQGATRPVVPSPVPSEPAPKQEPVPAKPPEPAPKETQPGRVEPDKPRPEALSKPVEASPPKQEETQPLKIALPKVKEKEEVPPKAQEGEKIKIASLPAAPSIAEIQKAPVPTKEQLPETVVRVRRPEAKPPETSKEAETRSVPPLSRLMPSPEVLSRVPDTGKQGTSASVPREEVVSLNTQEFKYYSYFVKLKRRIEEVWDYPREAQAQGQQGQLFMEFSIKKNGNLEDIKLLKSSRFVVLDQEAIRAVKVALAAPMPLPEAWGIDRLRVRASFTYELTFWGVQ